MPGEPMTSTHGWASPAEGVDAAALTGSTFSRGIGLSIGSIMAAQGYNRHTRSRRTEQKFRPPAASPRLSLIKRHCSRHRHGSAKRADRVVPKGAHKRTAAIEGADRDDLLRR